MKNILDALVEILIENNFKWASDLKKSENGYTLVILTEDEKTVLYKINKPTKQEAYDIFFDAEHLAQLKYERIKKIG